MSAIDTRREEARRLRATGWKLRAIADRFRVSVPTASAWCSGIDCPVDHTALRFQKWRQGRTPGGASRGVDEDFETFGWPS